MTCKIGGQKNTSQKNKRTAIICTITPDVFNILRRKQQMIWVKDRNRPLIYYFRIHIMLLLVSQDGKSTNHSCVLLKYLLIKTINVTIVRKKQDETWSLISKWPHA